MTLDVSPGPPDTAHLQPQMGIHLFGASMPDGAVRLDALGKLATTLVAALQAVEDEIRESRQTSIRVVQYSLGRPGTLLLLETPDGDADTRSGGRVFDRFIRELESVDRGEMPEDMEFPTLERFRDVAALSRQFSQMEFTLGRRRVRVNAETIGAIKELLARVRSSHGSVKGKLDAINLHSVPCVAQIYPAAGPIRIRCAFSLGQIPNIGDFLGRHVVVHGTKRYRVGRSHPFEIRITAIRALRPLRGLEDLGCSMPELLEGLTLEGYLALARGENDAA